MAEPRDPTGPAERYAAIEAAYCDDRWQDVLTQGQDLLGDLGPLDDALATALRQRVHLLMAHTHLHGFGDRDTAEDLYRQVLNTANAEPALRRSAEEGLQQCDQPAVRAAKDTAVAPAPAAAPIAASPPAPERPLPEPFAPPLTADPAIPFATAAAAPGRGPVQAAAAPWLEATPATAVDAEENPPGADSEPIAPPTEAAPLMPEVVEEPELLDVHRADPLRAEEIELELQDPASTAAAAAQVLAAAVTAEALAEVKAGRDDAAPAAVLEASAQPAPSEEAAVAEAAPLLDQEVFDEDDDDPELLEGLLQVALG